MFNVLFLCTGNSARSQMAEAILNRLGKGRFKAYSAGSHPTGQVHPMALGHLQRLNHPVEELRSKNWEEFAQNDAPVMDFVITVCDNAAGEVCPVWPGQPMTAHWSFKDPATVTGTDVEKSLAFAEVYRELNTRLEIFVALPMDQLDRFSLQQRVRDLAPQSQPLTD